MTPTTTIGLVHPGSMGAALGACLTSAGREVLWASEGRGETTGRRAGRAGLDDVGTLTALARRCDVVISVCPPHAARDVADDVAAAGFTGLYVEANAVSPATAGAVAGSLGAARVVDGGIIGPPPREPGTTRLYVSGLDAGAVADLFAGTVLEVVVCGDAVGRASAVKLAYAAWSKGSKALLASVADLAAAAGVEQELLDAWEWSDPSVTEELDRARSRAAERGWRWAGEMDEIVVMAKSLAVPSGFWSAAATRYGAEPRPTEG